MKLVFATNNRHKLEEIQQLLGDKIQLLSLADIKCTDEIPETGHTLEANAFQKSNYIYKKYGINCFADDTGLEIDALNGEPGVYSARYAGIDKDAEANMQLILKNLDGKTNRAAKFRTVISLIIDGQEHQFEGSVDGNICEVRSGSKGFGYDPIFQPIGMEHTFAEMSSAEKNKISHRGRAIEKLITFLMK